MRLTIKVKYILYVLIALLLITPILGFTLKPKWDARNASQMLNSGNEAGLTRVEQLLKSDLASEDRYAVIRDFIIKEVYSDSYDFYIVPSGYNMPRHSSIEFSSLEEAKPYIEEYVENGPVDEFLLKGAKQLASYYDRNLDGQASIEVLKRAAERFDTDHPNYLDMQLALSQQLLKYEQIEEAQEIIQGVKEVMQDTPSFVGLSVFDAEIAMRLGEKEQALASINEGIAAFEENKENEDYSKVFREYQGLTQLSERIDAGLSTVRGTIKRSDGTPLSHVNLILVGANDSKNRSLYTYNVITGEDGSYQFDGVPEGFYKIIVGITFNQGEGWTWPINNYDTIEVHEENTVYDVVFRPLLNLISPTNDEIIRGDDVTFKWEEVEGAAYYDMSFGFNGASSKLLFKKIPTNRFDITTSELQAINLVQYSNNNVNANSLLGFSNPELTFYWYVTAYDKDGKLLSRSNGYRLGKENTGNLPFFTLGARNLTEADKMVLSSRFGPALKQYRNNIANDPRDVHSIRMVNRLIPVMNQDLDEFEILRKKLPYLLALADLEPTEEVVFELSKYNFYKENFERLDEWYSVYTRLYEPNLDLDMIYVESLLKRDSVDEAITKLNKMAEVYEADIDRIIGMILAIEFYYNNKFDEGTEIAQLYKEYEPTIDWVNLVTMLQVVDKEKIDEILTLFFESQDKKLVELKDEEESQIVIDFIDVLRKVK
ncbi:hypothetical protein V7138_12980 [Bacillus sp. JJ1533]|uniref:hypothetical protein n=1 Tax=Bacillus sp. JJ1533 TaxID=3122959 RepID=UPI003000CD11